MDLVRCDEMRRKRRYMFYDGLSLPPVDPYHLHHGRGEDEGSSVV
jgi:hypothetical protein